MQPEVESLLDAYVEAWNEPDPERRGALLETALAPEAAFDGPTGTFRGRHAIGQLIDAVRSRMPGAAVERQGPASAVPGGVIRFSWRIRTSSGCVVMEGCDDVELAGGRLAVVRMRTGGVA